MIRLLEPENEPTVSTLDIIIGLLAIVFVLTPILLWDLGKIAFKNTKNWWYKRGVNNGR